MRVDKKIRFSDLFSVDQGRTMIILLVGGNRAALGIPMMIFRKDGYSYLIRGTIDYVPGV